ncbi:hypothetical protein IFT92_06940 [Peribacillus simplex]|uniref:hypothetical protein n=1 Tax=Peribacillus simplex TaxID=1478 RepID=UPI001923DA75|nr:hypothetical protein [Peribacillus simplex]MBD8587544.1 hypothetical protein [Peribacillus simplex]
MKKISLIILIAFISITFLLNVAMPELAGKMKHNISSMNILYSYSVTKTFSDQTHDTIEMASVPQGKQRPGLPISEVMSSLKARS